MRGQQRGERSVLRRHHRHRLHVARIREAEATVLRRNLDSERAHVAQLLHVVFRNVARAVDHIRIDASQEFRKLLHERARTLRFSRILGGIWMNEVEPESAEKKLANEAWA